MFDFILKEEIWSLGMLKGLEELLILFRGPLTPLHLTIVHINFVNDKDLVAI